jgi:transposase
VRGKGRPCGERVIGGGIGAEVAAWQEEAVKRPRAFGPLPHLRYRPEMTTCPHCQAPLNYSHAVWAKPVQLLTGNEHLINLGYRCSNAGCPFPRAVYRSAAAEARQVKESGYGLDVVVRIGSLRFGEHRTRLEIWEELQQISTLHLSERHVQNLIEVYLALLRASQRDPREDLARTVKAHGGIVLSLDGLQPEKGNEQLWIVREVLSGTVLSGENLRSASAEVLADLLRPIADLSFPVLGVISDAQESIREAVSTVFPEAPHQICQYHALREAARPLFEIDRHLAVQVRKELGGVREVGEQVERDPVDDLQREVVTDAILAVRQVTRTNGMLPFEFAGLRMLDDLQALGASLDRCLGKGGIAGFVGCAP